MAESTLSIEYTELEEIVGHFLGYGRDDSAWSTKQTNDVEAIIKGGIHQFYYPPPVTQGQRPHAWSFLTPVTTIDITSSDYVYDLPDDFGGIIGTFTYETNEGWGPIIIVGEGRIRELRQMTDSTGRPIYAAVRPVAGTGASQGQRFEVLFNPDPDGSYTLTYRYHSLPDKLTDALPYPLGGMPYRQAVVESCLAVAEVREDDEPGLHNRLFLQALQAAVAHDQDQEPDYYGYNSDLSDYREVPRSITYVTYEGTLYP